MQIPQNRWRAPSAFRAHLKGGNGKAGIRICLSVHCFSARSDRQPYCHTNATSPPCWRTTKLRATIACQYSVGTSCRGDIVLRSRSPRKCRYPLFAYPLFKRAQSLHKKTLVTRLVFAHTQTLSSDNVSELYSMSSEIAQIIGRQRAQSNHV